MNMWRMYRHDLRLASDFFFFCLLGFADLCILITLSSKNCSIFIQMVPQSLYAVHQAGFGSSSNWPGLIFLPVLFLWSCAHWNLRFLFLNLIWSSGLFDVVAHPPQGLLRCFSASAWVYRVVTVDSSFSSNLAVMSLQQGIYTITFATQQMILFVSDVKNSSHL